MSDRARGVAIGLALATCLIAGSPPRVVGDGGEYLAQAMNFASLSGPALGRRAILDIEPKIHALEPELAEWDIEAATVPASDRRRDFLHFWFYALVATPALWVVQAVGASPIYAFTLTNLTLVGLALWVLLPRVGPWGVLLILGGPLMWWFDKPHTEVFTATLLAIAFALRRERPAVAYVAAGMAATQNLPVAAVFLVFVALDILRTRGRILTDRASLVGIGAGAALAALHPAYNYARHGVPTLLIYATRAGIPTLAELAAAVADPEIGLIGNAPFFLVAVAIAACVAARKGWHSLLESGALAAAAAALVFLYAASQTSNTHHGATPSLMRYALWLLPLTVPVFTLAWTGGGRTIRGALISLALLSTATSVFAFHPAVPQYGREPTWMARWLWTSHPTWNNPLPEVFSEPQLRVEGTTVPVATDRCEKILIAPGDPVDGVWPIPCYPAELPALCRGRDKFCYANAVGGSYRFSAAPGREEPPLHLRNAAWPGDAEPHVRAIFDRWHWWDLVAQPEAVTVVRAGVDVQTAVFGTDARFLIVARPRGPSAVIRLRPISARLAGRIVDPMTGGTLRELAFAGAAGELWNVEIPADRSVVIVGLTTGELPE